MAGAEHEPHAPDPVPRDPDLPVVDDSTLGFVAAGALLVCIVALFTLLG